jgi:hypothetical protein
MPEPLETLLADGLVRRDGDRLRTTPRWQATMARAALGLQRGGARWGDLRLPIAAALLERYPEASDLELAALLESILPIEEAELAPAMGAITGGAPEPR